MPALPGLLLLGVLALLAVPAVAAEPTRVGIAYLALTPKRVTSQIVLDPPLTDEGVQGARLALADNQTTGRFLNQSFALNESVQADPDAVLAAARTMLAAGERVIVTDLPAALLLQVAGLPGADAAIL
ncbi:MAG: branched-chain amino acid ABC transporter substrate-binding protein, partial [Gemmatimonadaceae bacterium]|nr:branched-chain amino acid ABC transporter substrate-binding protein [Acetobacteraceae bacterium]